MTKHKFFFSTKKKAYFCGNFYLTRKMKESTQVRVTSGQKHCVARSVADVFGRVFVLTGILINVFIMGYVTFSLGCYTVCCSVASLAVGYIYLSCSHLYSFASYDSPYALKIKYPVIRGFFYT